MKGSDYQLKRFKNKMEDKGIKMESVPELLDVSKQTMYNYIYKYPWAKDFVIEVFEKTKAVIAPEIFIPEKIDDDPDIDAIEKKILMLEIEIERLYEERQKLK